MPIKEGDRRCNADQITREQAQAFALEAVLACFKDDPIRQKALRVSVSMKKVQEGGKTYWLVEYFGSNGKAKIAIWTQVPRGCPDRRGHGPADPG